MKATAVDRKADYVGIAGSILCIIHCLAAPLVVVSSSLLKNDLALQSGFLSLDYVFIIVNIVAVYFATRHHHSRLVSTALWCFLALFGIGLLLEDYSPIFEYMAYTASAGLVVSHLLNLRQHRVAHFAN
jgi:hypothetical protein